MLGCSWKPKSAVGGAEIEAHPQEGMPYTRETETCIHPPTHTDNEVGGCPEVGVDRKHPQPGTQWNVLRQRHRLLA